MPNFNNPFKRNKRAGTTSVFDAKTKPRDEAVAHKITEQSKAADEANKTDLAVETNKGKDPESEGPAKLVTKPKEDEDKRDEVQKSYGTTSNEITQDDITDAFWDASLSYKMIQTTYSGISFYVPNAMPLFIILEEALRLVGASSYLGKFYSNFCPYAVLTGYAYIYHFQILKAKEKAGQLDGYEQSTYNRFFKTYSEESIPIPDIIYPYLQSIVSTKFQDVKYNWICPTISPENADLPFSFSTYNATTTTGGFSDTHGLGKIVPNIPAMLMMIASFGSETQTSVAGKIDSNGKYTPAPLADRMNLFRLGANHFDFRTPANPTVAGDAHSIFNTCGPSTPFKFYTTDTDSARRSIANSSFIGRKNVDFGVIDSALANGTTNNQTVDFNRYDRFMNMQKEKSLAFFEYLLENMLIFCKFFPAKRNFSNLKGSGGLETTILCSLRTSDAYAGRHLYADTRCGIDTIGDVTWFPNPTRNGLFSDLTADFMSTKAGITRAQELQALTFGTVSMPPIHGLTITNFRRGKYYQDVSEQTKKYEIGNFEGTSAGTKPMYQTFTTDVLVRFLVSKPT